MPVFSVIESKFPERLLKDCFPDDPLVVLGSIFSNGSSPSVLPATSKHFTSLPFATYASDTSLYENPAITLLKVTPYPTFSGSLIAYSL